jgi:hypothetical protein
VRTYGSAREVAREFRTVRVGEALPGQAGARVLSQYYEERHSLDLIGKRADGVGYLLKERVGDVESFIDAVTGSPEAAAHLT